MLGVMYYKAENSKEIGEIAKLRKKGAGKYGGGGEKGKKRKDRDNRSKGRRKKTVRKGKKRTRREGARRGGVYGHRDRTCSCLTQNKESYLLNEPVRQTWRESNPHDLF